VLFTYKIQFSVCVCGAQADKNTGDVVHCCYTDMLLSERTAVQR